MLLITMPHRQAVIVFKLTVNLRIICRINSRGKPSLSLLNIPTAVRFLYLFFFIFFKWRIITELKQFVRVETRCQCKWSEKLLKVRILGDVMAIYDLSERQHTFRKGHSLFVRFKRPRVSQRQSLLARCVWNSERQERLQLRTLMNHVRRTTNNFWTGSILCAWDLRDYILLYEAKKWSVSGKQMERRAVIWQ